MGHTWEVSVWIVEFNDEEEWKYKSVYQGNSLLKAIQIMWKQRHKFGWIKWRPNTLLD
jgi:hypothetical protein